MDYLKEARFHKNESEEEAKEKMKIDYLSDARKWLRDVAAAPTDVGVVYTIASAASALIALTERIDTTAQDIASRVELASEITGKEFPDKLASIVLTNTNLLKVLNERIDKIETSTNRRLVSLSELFDGRLKKLEFGKDGEAVEQIDALLWERFKLAEHGHIMNRDRLDEIEKAMASVVVLRVGDCAVHDRRIDGLKEAIDEMDSRVFDLEAPALPRVGVWQRCGKCEGKGEFKINDSDPVLGCDVCGGSGMVEVYVNGRVQVSTESERHTSEAEWADRLQMAAFSVATLERKLDGVLQIINDVGLSGDEIRDAVDDLD